MGLGSFSAGSSMLVSSAVIIFNSRFPVYIHMHTYEVSYIANLELEAFV